jgi:tyrosine-protein kinase Etk/Wzc
LGQYVERCHIEGKKIECDYYVKINPHDRQNRFQNYVFYTKDGFGSYITHTFAEPTRSRNKRNLDRTTEIISRKDVIRVVAVALTNWYILLSVPIVTLAISVLYTYRLADVYAAKCQILLKSNETYDYQNELYRGLGFNSKYASYEETASQMRVLKSTGLLEKVMESLPLDVSYFIVGRVKVSEVYKHMPFRVITDQRSSASSGLRFDLTILDTAGYRLSYEQHGKMVAAEYKFGDLILDGGLYLKVEKEPNLTQISLNSLSQIDYQFVVHQKQSLIGKYKNAIDVQNIDYTSIVEITVKDEIPQRAVEVLDTLAKIYVHNTLSNQREVNENTLSYIDLQLNEVTSIINDIENELELYKEGASILNLTREEETYFQRLLEMDAELRGFERQVEALDDLTTYLLKEEELESLLPPNLFVSNTDPELEAQVKDLYAIRSEYTKSLGSSTQNNPRSEGLLRDIRQQKNDIIRYIDSQKTAVSGAMRQLEDEIGAMEGRIKNIPKSQRQIINIERRLAVNEELYSFLLSRRAETIIARAGIVPETKIIEASRPIGIVFPDKTKMNLMSLLMGVGAAILILILKELFFQKIKSLGQLQTSTEIPILGSVPKQKHFSKTYRLLSGSERSDLAQSFRMLRTNLQFIGGSDAGKKILVTSLLPGEGKTFVSVNLASVLAIADKRVLLMDFDLHKPRLAKAMEMDNAKGVSSFLSGRHGIVEVIQKSEVETLDVITSGPVPPNASELILRPELQDLFNFAQENYDFVLIDTPPVSLITDALNLMPKMDVKLFVLNSRSTSRTSLDYIERLIQNNQLNDVSLVLNEEKVTKLDYYYSRYGYGGYGYGGYGYGNSYGYSDYFDKKEPS